MHRSLTRLAIACLPLAILIGLSIGTGNAATSGPLQFLAPVSLPGAAGGTEPRVSVGPDGTMYAVSASDTISSARSVPLTVYASHNGGATWAPTKGAPSASSPSADVDIVTTRTGRILVAVLGTAAIN